MFKWAFIAVLVIILNAVLQLTFEQHGYELRRSTYTRIFQLTPRLGILVCGGRTVVIHGFFIFWEVGSPNPHVQGSTAFSKTILMPFGTKTGNLVRA